MIHYSRFFTVLFFVCCSLLPVHADDWTKGQMLLNEGQYTEALEVFNAVWTTDPKQTGLEAYIDICKKMVTAQKLFTEARYEDALQLTEEVSVVLPQNEKIKMLLAQRRQAAALKEDIRQKYKEGDHKALLQDYQDLLDLNPQDERTSRAINAYRQFSFQLDKARSLFRTGEWDGSLSILKKAWTLLPADQLLQEEISMNVQALAAKDLFLESDYTAAAGAFKDLFHNYPRFDIFRDYLERSYSLQRLSTEARVYFAEGELARANDTAQIILRLNPEDIGARDILKNAQYAGKVLTDGDNLLMARKYREAQDLFAEGAKKLPSMAAIRERLTATRAILEGQEQKNKAFTPENLARYTTFRDLDKYVQLHTKKATPLVQETELVQHLVDLRNEGLELFFKTDYAAAIRKFDEALRIDAQDQTSLRYRDRAARAGSYREQIKKEHAAGNDTEAERLYQMLIFLNPQERPLQEIVP
jgi:hypothetical protein